MFSLSSEVTSPPPPSKFVFEEFEKTYFRGKIKADSKKGLQRIRGDLGSLCIRNSFNGSVLN